MTAFIGTNILIYAQSIGRKSEVAKGVIYSGGVISVQVLNEFVNVARYKLKYPWEEISGTVSGLTAVTFLLSIVQQIKLHSNLSLTRKKRLFGQKKNQ